MLKTLDKIAGYAVLALLAIFCIACYSGLQKQGVSVGEAFNDSGKVEAIYVAPLTKKERRQLLKE